MAKRIRQQRDLFGYDGFPIEETETFIYEYFLGKYQKNIYNVLDNKFFKSDKLLKNKREIHRYKDYIIEQSFLLIGASLNFIKENNLPIFEYTKKKKLKKNERTR